MHILLLETASQTELTSTQSLITFLKEVYMNIKSTMIAALVASLPALTCAQNLELGLGAQIKIAGDGDIHADKGAVKMRGSDDYLAFPMQIDSIT